jgi:hypothetical protein
MMEMFMRFHYGGIAKISYEIFSFVLSMNKKRNAVLFEWKTVD